MSGLIRMECSQTVRFSEKLIKWPIIAIASKVEWEGVSKVSPYLIS
jgi:hypothetical protein